MKILSLASLIFLIFLAGFKGLIASKVESRAMKTDGNNILENFTLLYHLVEDVQYMTT